MSMRNSCLKLTECKLKEEEETVEILKYQIMWSGWITRDHEKKKTD